MTDEQVRSERWRRAGWAATAVLFLAGMVYVGEHQAPRPESEHLIARLDWPPGYSWRLVAAAVFTPLPGQKRAPCAGSELDRGGFCWAALEARAPCSPGAVESNGRCYVPMPGAPLEPGKAQGR